MKKIPFFVLPILLVAAAVLAWLSFTSQGKNLVPPLPFNNRSPEKISPAYINRLKSRAPDARSFARKNKYNEDYCFLVDMSLPSGNNRMFVYDLQKDTITNSGLVTHGRCNEEWLEGRKYSNTIGGGCTSLGKYKIGNSYYGRFGLAFKLYGLEKTNHNAFARYVVLHAHECVPESEVSDEICQSDGCPTVAPLFLKILEPLIKNSSKPILLWIYE